MDHDMGNIRENLKKWLKDTVPSNGVNGSFDEEGIKGEYDSTREAVVIQPSEKEYFREKIEDSFYDEREIEKVIDDIFS